MLTSSLFLALSLSLAAQAQAQDAWAVPVSVRRLDNGLTVVVSPDHSSPNVGVGVVYHVGMRSEPEGRGGFAHLFEHLMFGATPSAPKGTFGQVLDSAGGRYQGSTRSDFTRYWDAAPRGSIEPLLWLEADRMRGLAVDEASLANEKAVIKEEIRVNVTNQPYAAFEAIGLASLAFDTWPNRHDGYGSFADLDAATLADVRSFHEEQYGPGNAVVAISGDVDTEEAFNLAKKYFGPVPARTVPKAGAFDEPLNRAPRWLEQDDPLATLPGLAVGWKGPRRGSEDHVPMAVLSQLLLDGRASRLTRALVDEQHLLVDLEGGLNYPLGNPWEYDGPALLSLKARLPVDGDAKAVVAAIDAQVAAIAREGVDDATLARVKRRMLSSWYASLESMSSRADQLAKLQLLWDDAGVVNRIPRWIADVRSSDLQRVASTYLVTANRSVIVRRPAPAQEKSP